MQRNRDQRITCSTTGHQKNFVVIWNASEIDNFDDYSVNVRDEIFAYKRSRHDLIASSWIFKYVEPRWDISMTDIPVPL